MFTHTLKIEIKNGELVYDRIPGAIYKIPFCSYEWMCCRGKFAQDFVIVHGDFWSGYAYLCRRGRSGAYPWLINRWIEHCSSASAFKCKCITLLHRAGFGYTSCGAIPRWSNVLRRNPSSYGFISTLKKIKQFQVENPDKFFDVMVSDHLMVGVRRSPAGFSRIAAPTFTIKFSVDTTELSKAMNRLHKSIGSFGRIAVAEAQKHSKTISQLSNTFSDVEER